MTDVLIKRELLADLLSNDREKRIPATLYAILASQIQLGEAVEVVAATDYDSLKAERDTLRQQLAERDAQIERLQMQLAACGVVALANTPGSAGEARQMHPDYMSASCSDVADAVDREIAMRQQRDNIAQILRDLVPGCKWRIMRPRIDAALAEIDNADE